MSRQVAMLLVSALLFAGFALSGVSGNAQDDAFKKELKAMAGIWKPIAAETDGNKVPDNILKDNTWTRDEDGKVVLKRDDKTVQEWKVKKIDATKKLKWIDMEVVVGGPGLEKGQTFQCIYELDGDTLRICMPHSGKADRPKEFSAGSGSKCTIAVYKREKK